MSTTRTAAHMVRKSYKWTATFERGTDTYRLNVWAPTEDGAWINAKADGPTDGWRLIGIEAAEVVPPTHTEE